MTVKAWLKGDHFDLESLAELFPDGNIRVVKEGADFYLTATEITSPPNGRKFHETAPEVLQRVNGLARALRPNDYKPVELVGRYQVGESQHHFAFLEDFAGGRDRILPPTITVGSSVAEGRGRVTAVGFVVEAGTPVAPPLPGPKYLALAAHPHVAEALAVMGNTDPNWVDLYKVYEIIREDIRPAKMHENGWVTRQDLNAFGDSANRPDVSGADARHARRPGRTPTDTMSLQQARQFIGDLLIRWIDGLQP
jgi:hypothetical protein